MTEISKTYAMIMPTVKIKPKTKQQEVKEIIQDPDDPLAKFPVRAMGYANEVGAAVSAMPGWGKAAETALWVPALMYLGADIYDKYKRGKDGNYSKASASAAVQQATFQALASVILPTAAVKMGQGIAAHFSKYDGTNLSATAKEELYQKLFKDFNKAKFAKGDIINNRGEKIDGFDRVFNKVYNSDYTSQLHSTRMDLKNEGVWSKIVRFFGHTSKPVASSKANEEHVREFLKNKVKDIYDTQRLLETSTKEMIEQSSNNKLIKLYRKAEKNIEQKVQNLMKESPSLVIKKILNSNDESLKPVVSDVMGSFANRAELKNALSKEKTAGQLLERLMQNPEHKKSISAYAKKVEISREILQKYIKGNELKLGSLKTVGGFIALGCLAIPIDHFVHKFIIKKFVEPGLESVERLQAKLSFKKNENNKSV